MVYYQLVCQNETKEIKKKESAMGDLEPLAAGNQ